MKKFSLFFIMLVASAFSFGFSQEEQREMQQAFAQFSRQQGAYGGAMMVTAADGDVASATYGIRNAKRDPYLLTTPNRIASVSKMVTATAMMTLVKEGKITLETKVLDFLNEKREKILKPVDNRMGEITVRHLLNHTSGFISDSFMWNQIDTARAFGYSTPIPKSKLVDHALTRVQLGTYPGSTYKYSNIGMLILGRVIEKASGTSYEAYVRKVILGPAGISADQAYVGKSRELGITETSYWDLQKRTGMSLYPGDNFKKVPFPEGGAYTLEEMDAYGGWVFSVDALTKFQLALPKLIPSELQQEITIRPRTSPQGTSYHGLGFMVIPESLGGHTFYHDGNLEGCSATAMFRANGQVISITFNTGSSPSTNNWAGNFRNNVLIPLLNRIEN